MKYFFTIALFVSFVWNALGQVSPPTDTSFVTTCDSYVSNTGIEYTMTTVFIDTVNSDSSFYTDLTINPFVDPTLTVSPGQCAPYPTFNFSASSSLPVIQKFRWYDQLTGGSLLNVGSSYVDSFNTSTDVFVVQAGAEASMPPQTSLNVGNTGGYWFVAPNSFVITSLFVPSIDSSKFQNVAVVKMDDNLNPPTASLTTNDFSTLFLSRINYTAGAISVNIQVNQGDVIGILGSRESDNSYSNVNNITVVNGDTLYLTRFAFPGQLTTTDPYNVSSFPLNDNISRVVFEYTSNDVCINPDRKNITAVVYPTYHTMLDTTVCDSFTSPTGKFFDFSQTVLDTLQSQYICDSVVEFDLTVNFSSLDSIDVSACDSFIASSGSVHFSSSMFYDTTYYSTGCFKIKHINLSMYNSSDDSATIVACDEFVSPKGKHITTDSLFSELLQSSHSCDSLVYFDVTINYSASTVDTINACDSHISINQITYDTSVIYYDTLQTSLSCDSVVKRVVIINYSTLDSLVEVHCDSYTSPNGTIHTSSQTFYDTLSTVNSCDSVIYVDLTINNSTTESLIVDVCDSYTSPIGTIYTSSAVFSDTLNTQNNCDSIINIDLTIKYSTDENLSIEVCDTFVSPLGNGYNSSSIFTEVLSTSEGCDSTIHFFLTVLHSSSENVSIVACESFTSPLGNVYASSAQFSDTLSSIYACDSILNFDLTIVNSSMDILSETVCDEYTSPLGNTYYSSQTVFDTLLSIYGCDSVLQIELVVNSSMFDTLYPVVCDEYISGGLITYDSSGVYTEQYQTAVGCDSIVTFIVEVDPLILTVNKEDDLLESLDFDASYQWINCTTGTVISGETSRMFIAPANESYAVIVDNSICIDTSDCVMVNSIGTGIIWLENVEVALYPNPVNEVLMISSSEVLQDMFYQLFDLKGRVVGEGILNGSLNRINVQDLNQGMYFLKIENTSIPILKAE